jgi:ABC-type uncharacterized transport system involved in gliding motility auxiliary subunit
MNKGILSLGALVLAAALFLAINIVGMSTIRGARVDLTQHSLYTLSQGSKNIAAKIDEPITLTLYFSESMANGEPQAKTYARRVQEVLREYQHASGGKIKLNVVDPLPFSDEEDQAVQAQLFGVPRGPGGERFYFGLVGRNSTDQQQVIPFFNPAKEQFLEYDLTRTIHLLANPDRKTIGIMAALPVEGMPHNPMMTQQVPPWQFVSQLRQMFDVRTIEREANEIPADVQVLVVVHPKNIQERTLYAIDQFVLRGGRLVVFVDPWCEVDFPPGINPMQAMSLPRDSNLTRLFDAWGIEMLEQRIAADRRNAIPVTVGSQSRPEQVDYVAWMSLKRDNFNRDDTVTGALQQINIGTSGILRQKSGANTKFDPLIRTSTESMALDVTSVQFNIDPKKLISEFKNSGEELVLAARISGPVGTAFPEGNPYVSDPEHPEANSQPHRAQSADDVNIIVVADADMLHDRFWITEDRMGPIIMGYRKVADNGDFVLGAIDNLTGSSDLISVRARGQFSRPFTRVEEIKKDAETRFLAKEQELQRKLQEAQANLEKLRSEQPSTSMGGQIILTPEQQAEIEKYKTQVVETRRELRVVQHQLQRDIEALGTRLKVINIGVMPLTVGLAAIGLSVVRVNRRRNDRVRAGTRS